MDTLITLVSTYLICGLILTIYLVARDLPRAFRIPREDRHSAFGITIRILVMPFIGPAVVIGLGLENL